MSLIIGTACPNFDAPAVIEFTNELLRHGTALEEIRRHVDAGSENPIEHACCATLFMFLQTRDGQEQAEPYIASAERLLKTDSSQVEKHFVSAIRRWHSGDLPEAIRHLNEILKARPDHLLAAKICQILQLNAGDVEGMLTTAGHIDAQAGAPSFRHGLIAFAAQQNKLVDKADTHAKKGCEITPADAWCQHAQAHVYLAQGKLDDALTFLEERAESWDTRSSFMYTHNWWHIALLHLHRGDVTAALEVFDTHIWTQRKHHVQDQLNAISLLIHIEAEGHDVGYRWTDVAGHAKDRAQDHLSPLFDLHVLCALVRTGKTAIAKKTLKGIEQMGRTAKDQSRWHDIALPLAQAIVHGTSDDGHPIDTLLTDLSPQLHLLGGSDEQRDTLHAWHRFQTRSRELASGAAA